MQTLSLKARLLYGIAGAAFLAALPIHVDFDASGWTVKPSVAWAKNGGDDDDSGSDDSGGSGGRGGSGGGGSDDDDDDSGSDDSGGSGGRGGSGGGGSDDGDDDDSGSDDRGGSGGGSDDDDDDDSGSDDRGGSKGGSGGGSDDDDDSGSDDDDDDDDSGRGGSDDRSGDDDRDDDRSSSDDDDDDGREYGFAGGKVEISRNGIEVERRDGTKEEIENGRYERKDRFGNTVEERPATQADIDRLRGLAGAAGVAASRDVSTGAVTKVEIKANGIEVSRADGTKEEIENGRYERKDRFGNTIEERRATQADVERLKLASRNGPKPVRKIEVGRVAEIERSTAGVEITYSTGWREELQNGRYELKDPNDNTVVERVATNQDKARLARLAGN